MEESDGGVVILGAGHAGGAMALELRKLGYARTVTLVGEEQQRPYERPSLSKEFLVGLDPAPQFLVPADIWTAQGLTTMLETRAVEIDRTARHLLLSNGTRLPYGRLVIATGGVPRRPLWPDHPAIHTLRNADDAAALRKRAREAGNAVILGGGVIGLEVASSFQSLGLKVAVIERGQRLMTRNVPVDMALKMQAFHEAAGTVLHLGRMVEIAKPVGNTLLLVLDNGVELTSSLVVVGIGITPDSAIAERAGLACDDGITVDTNYVTDDPDIYAIGDVAHSPRGRNESWAHAQTSARAAARTILGLDPEPEPFPWFWTTQFGHTLQVAGHPHAADRTIARGAVSLYGAAERLAGLAALDAPREFAAGRRLIGRALDWQRARDPEADLRHLAL